MRTGIVILGSVVLGAAVLASCSPPSEKAQPAPAASTSAAVETPAASAAPAASVEGVPAGKYVTDKVHSSLIFGLSHMGFAQFRAKFSDWSAELELDPKNPSDAKLSATIDPKSLVMNAPEKGFQEIVTGEGLLDVKKFPTMTFKSTSVKVTGPNTAEVTGDFTFHGATKPVTLNVTYNNGYPGMLQDPQARIGFSATGKFRRSDFGMDAGLPPPGSSMGVGDEVSFSIETEMTGPAFKPPGSDVTLTPKPQ